MSFRFQILLFFSVAVSLNCASRTLDTTDNDPQSEGVVIGERSAPDDPKIMARLDKIKSALGQTPPVLKQHDLSEESLAAQDLAISDERFTRESRDPNSKEPLLNEIFGVYPLRESDYLPQTQSCRQSRCFRVEMYNFALNLTTNAVVDINARSVLVVTRVPQSQPDIPPHLTELAIHIAKTSNAVVTALGGENVDAIMANTKTSLNRTRCERSRHLCVAPTFVTGDRALWAIVDLTDLSLVGTRWTQVGITGPPVTEKSLQNSVLTKNFCEKNTQLEKGGWKLSYALTNSDGLKISNVSFGERPVLQSAKLVDWHVNYSNTEGFGYSDAVGCPYFSQAAVVAAVQPRVVDIKGGFSLVQKYYSDGYPTPCNYSYEQRFDFYNDGRFRVVVASLGRGCGDDGTYRPVTRIAFAGEQNKFAEWSGAEWKVWQNEGWRLQSSETPLTPEDFQYKIDDPAGRGYFLQANRGQFGDGGRGDNAYVYVTRNTPERDEGESDLVTIAPCCNLDHQQGPEKFIDPQPEPVANSSLVVWYVAQLKNDGAKGREYCWAESVIENGIYKVKEYPCYSGPMFVPTR